MYSPELNSARRSLSWYWNPAYSCFTFRKVDLVPTIEEYTTLLHYPRIQVDKAYSRAANVSTFLKRLISITRMIEQWFVGFDLGASGYEEKSRRLHLEYLRKASERRFIECAQLLLTWFHSHFWKVENVSYRVFSENYSPLKELVATLRRDYISEEKWMAILQNFVPMWKFKIWGDIGYVTLLVLRQYRSRQFIQVMQGLTQWDFAYKGNNYKKKVREISNTWNQTHKIKRFVVNPMTTLEYDWWWGKRVNDNVLKSSHENTRSIEEHLQVIPSELEIIKQDFEKRRSELGKR
ncbi:hypothetical protein Godav_024012 [Gossypium davidsonii]|uniref:DUF7745 domain-containing protein n=2 Tax=Gossypium davidsonii TaxID=34287 RepID=A0A7J8SV78_GOSDV|nr:hypothetical protein [Gossypium davidsonii]